MKRNLRQPQWKSWTGWRLPEKPQTSTENKDLITDNGYSHLPIKEGNVHEGKLGKQERLPFPERKHHQVIINDRKHRRIILQRLMGRPVH